MKSNKYKDKNIQKLLLAYYFKHHFPFLYQNNCILFLKGFGYRIFQINPANNITEVSLF